MTIIDQIKAQLISYLKIHKMIDGNKVRCCFTEDHAHGDSNKSASIPPWNNQMVHCFTCNRNYDIFKVANKIENLPISGPEFWGKTVPKLAKMFNIPYDLTTIDEDYKLITEQKRFNLDVSDYITNNIPDDAISYAENRDISEEERIQYRIGGIIERKLFHKYLTDQGWSTDDIRRFGGYQQDLFTSDNLIFSIMDKYGDVVGFVGRYMKYKKTTSRSKYVNSTSNAVYIKNQTLYGINWSEDTNHGQIFIVEGYIDLITLRRKGIKNVVALGGIALSEKHLKILERCGYKDIVIMLDSDTGGEVATSRAATILQKFPNLTGYVLKLPENEDPDSYLKSHDTKDLLALELTPIHIYFVDQIISTKDSESSLEAIAEYIASFDNVIIKNKITKDILNNYSINPDDLKDYIHQKSEDIRLKKSREIQTVKFDLIRELKNQDVDIIDLVIKYHNRIKEIKSNTKLNMKEILEETIEYSNTIKMAFEETSTDDYYELGIIPPLNSILGGGIPRHAALLTIGGASFSGKSIKMRNIALNLLQHGNANIIYVSIDEGPLYTLKCLKSSMCGIPLKMVSNIRNIEKTPFVITSELKSEGITINDVKSHIISNIRSSQITLDQMIENKQLTLIGSKGTNPSVLYTEVEKLLREIDNAVLFVDSFQQMNSSDRTDSEFNGKMLRQISNDFNIPVIISSELTKQYSTSKPTNEGLKDTSKIEYLSEVVILAHNISKTNGANSAIDVSNYPDKYIRSIAPSYLNTKGDVIDYVVTKNRINGMTGNYKQIVIPYALRLEDPARIDQINNTINNVIDGSQLKTKKSPYKKVTDI